YNLRGAEIFELERQPGGPFQALVAGTVHNATLTGGDNADLLRVAGIYGDWNSVFGPQISLGRWFSGQERAQGGGSGALVLSESVWKRRYGANPAILGTSIALDHRSYRVIGIMRGGFHFPYSADAWTSETMVAASVDDYAVFARLKEGVSIDAARAS